MNINSKVAMNAVAKNALTPSGTKLYILRTDKGTYLDNRGYGVDRNKATVLFGRDIQKIIDKFGYELDEDVFLEEVQSRSANSVVRNASVPSGWKVVKEGKDSWYGDYLALVQSKTDPSKWTCFTSGKLLKPVSKQEAEKDYMEFATKTYNSVVRNALAMNWNYKNSYKFFCVDPSMKAPCILSGWDFREDAQEDAQELKELHIPYKIVSRVTLERAGIDPNAESSWSKNRR